MDPQHHSMIARVPPFWTRMMHLDHHAQSTPHLYHTLGKGFRVQMRMSLIAGDKGRAYVIILALTIGLQALLIHLETHEYVIVPSHPLGDTTRDLLGYQRIPYSLCLESILSPWHTFNSTRPSQWPDGSLCLLFCPLERLNFLFWSYLDGLVTKGCYYCTLFYYLGLNYAKLGKSNSLEIV